MAAAGASARFGGPQLKQHAPLAGRTVLEVALELFVADAHCLGIALALAPAAVADPVQNGRWPAKVWPLAGGAQRCDSVLLALDSLRTRASDDEWVLVHDAARPLLTAQDLRRLLEAGFNQHSGALLAAPVTDTLKQSTVDQRYAERTVERSGLWRALTPQMFRLGALSAALRNARAAGRVPTDEAQAIEWQGGQPLLVTAQDVNIKVTRQEDLALVAALLATREVRST